MKIYDPTPGRCPGCGREGRRLYEHHCHVHDAFMEAVRCGLALVVSPDAAEERVRRGGAWTSDPRIAEVLRFPPVKICSDCNHLDTCDLASRPGPYFSLTLPEIARVRTLSGTTANGGKAVIEVLRQMREEAAPDYASRVFAAGLLGRWTAREILDQEAMRERYDMLDALADDDGSLMVPDDWAYFARRAVSKAMSAGKLDYDDLSACLAKVGYVVPARALFKRFNGGRFSAALFLHSLSALGVETLDIPADDRLAQLAGEGRVRRERSKNKHKRNNQRQKTLHAVRRAAVGNRHAQPG